VRRRRSSGQARSVCYWQNEDGSVKRIFSPMRDKLYVKGKQYVVIAAGGGKGDSPSGDEYVAFALPEPRA